jgi:acyl carrier protein
MSSTSTSGAIDALTAVRDAVALVCEVDAAGLTGSTSFEELGADSLARVSIADVVEAAVAAGTGRTVRIDDTTLGAVATLDELAATVARKTESS